MCFPSYLQIARRAETARRGSTTTSGRRLSYARRASQQETVPWARSPAHTSNPSFRRDGGYSPNANPPTLHYQVFPQVARRVTLVKRPNNRQLLSMILDIAAAVMKRFRHAVQGPRIATNIVVADLVILVFSFSLRAKKPLAYNSGLCARCTIFLVRGYTRMFGQAVMATQGKPPKTVLSQLRSDYPAAVQ